jgi:RNA polymerase sigma-70 factor (ECF subfamily)
MKLSDQELNDFLIDSLESDVYFEGSEIQLQLQKVIDRLPQQQKTVFNMRYFEDIPYEEMSEILGSSVGALKSNYHHARKKVENFLKQD